MKMTIQRYNARAQADGRRFTVSTEGKDRHGTVLKQNWRLEDFKAAGSPALLNHSPNQIVGSWADLKVEDGALSATFVPAEEGTSPVADAARSLVDQGLLKGASVGFIPHSFDYNAETDTAILDDLELMEISLTPVPSNPQAVAALRALGLDAMQTRQLLSEQPEQTMTENTNTAPNTAPNSSPARTVPPNSPAIHTTERKYSLARAIAGMLQIPGAQDAGLEREVGDEMAKRNPHKSWNGVPVPFAALFPSMQRANAGAPGGTGHPLTGTAYLDSLLSIQGGAMPKEMIAGRLGGGVIATNELVAQLPIVDGKVTATTVALDSDIPLSDFSSDNVTVSPVTAGARTQIKRSLFYSQHPDAEGIIRSQVSAAVAEELDKVWLGPTGGAPQPSGLVDLASAATLTPVPATLLDWLTFREELLNYMNSPQGVPGTMFLLPSILANKLATTEQWTGNTAQPVLVNGTIGGTPVATTQLLDVSTPLSVPVFVGVFSEMITVLFNQGGVDTVANPWIAGSWEHGGFELRSLIDYSVHCVDPMRIKQSVADAS